MERIKSFEINHNVLVPGFYISRVDGDVVTYDLRTRKPNAGDYMDNAAMHSLEHMFATLVRNSEMSEDVVYFGPMGCQTGFYLLVRDKRSHMEVFEMTKKVLEQTLAHEGRCSALPRSSADIMRICRWTRRRKRPDGIWQCLRSRRIWSLPTRRLDASRVGMIWVQGRVAAGFTYLEV